MYWLPPVKLYFRPDHSDLAEPSSFHIRQVSAGVELFQVIPKYDKPLCNGALICVWIDSRQAIAGVEHFQIIQNFDSEYSYHVEDANFAKRSQEVLEGSGIASNWFSLTML